MIRLSSTFLLSFIVTITLDFATSRPSELFGSGVSQTGSKWPPYPGAGLDYWALQAGHYGPVADVLKERNDESMKMPLAKVQVIPMKTVQRLMVPHYVQAFHPRPHMLVYG